MRYYCHSCRTHISAEDLLPDFTCPNCRSTFIEELEAPSQSHTIEHVLQDFMSGTSFTTQYPGDISSSSSSSSQTNNPQSSSSSFIGADRFVNIDFPIPYFLNSDIGDYAWGNAGFDAVITQLLNNLDGCNSGPPPMPKDQVDDLPRVRISDEHTNSNNSQCTICMEDFRIGDIARRLPCEHFFHQDCIIPWLNLHASCPICRKTFIAQNTSTPLSQSSSSNQSTPHQARSTRNIRMTGSASGSNTNTNTDTNTIGSSSSRTSNKPNVNLKEEDCD